MTEWVSALERLPEPDQLVLLISEGWQGIPEVVRYSPNYQGWNCPKFYSSGRGLAWWYPERMHWMAIPPVPPKAQEGT